MKKLKAIWELMRLEHGIMIFIAILIGAVISQRILYDDIQILPVDKFILTFFTALFLEASTFALNDYFDLEIDKKNKRTDRPLVRGDVSPKTALILFFTLFPLGLLSSFFVNWTCFIIALITGLLAIFYDAKLKKVKLIGNFYIAYTMAIPFIFGAAAVIEGNTLFFDIPKITIIIALIAFLAGSGREIMKDVMDFEGDKEKGVKSFPKYIGKKNSNIIASLFYLSAIALSFLPYISANYEIYYRNIYYMIIILLTDIMLLITAVRLIQNKTENMKIYRKMSLIAIFVGLIAFFVGAFV